MTKLGKDSALSRRRMIKGAGALAAGLAAPAFLRVRSAYAAYPDRPVKIVVANTPGGPSDIVGRIVTAALQQSTGKTFIVENHRRRRRQYRLRLCRQGGPGRLHDSADHQRLLGQRRASINQLPYNTARISFGVCELATLAQYLRGQSRLAGENDKGVRRARPGQSGQIQLRDAADRHLVANAARILESDAKNCRSSRTWCSRAAATRSPRCSAAPCSSAPARCAPALPHIKAGTLRCLAVTGENAGPSLPDVPTMQEAGYKDFVFAVDCALLAPAKTPPEAVKWLEAETLKVLKTKDIKDKLYKAGFLVRAQGADACWARVTKEITLFQDIIETARSRRCKAQCYSARHRAMRLAGVTSSECPPCISRRSSRSPSACRCSSR